MGARMVVANQERTTLGTGGAASDIARAQELLRAAARRPLEPASEPAAESARRGTPQEPIRLPVAASRGLDRSRLYRTPWDALREPLSGITILADGTYRPTTRVWVLHELRKRNLLGAQPRPVQKLAA